LRLRLQLEKMLPRLPQAIEKAPPPPPGTDVQSYKLVSVEVEFGGLTGSTKTRVCVEVVNGPLPEP